MTQHETAEFVTLLRKTFTEVEALPMPCIAAIEGALFAACRHTFNVCMNIYERINTAVHRAQPCIAAIEGGDARSVPPQLESSYAHASGHQQRST